MTNEFDGLLTPADPQEEFKALKEANRLLQEELKRIRPIDSSGLTPRDKSFDKQLLLVTKKYVDGRFNPKEKDRRSRWKRLKTAAFWGCFTGMREILSYPERYGLTRICESDTDILTTTP